MKIFFCRPQTPPCGRRKPPRQPAAGPSPPFRGRLGRRIFRGLISSSVLMCCFPTCGRTNRAAGLHRKRPLKGGEGHAKHGEGVSHAAKRTCLSETHQRKANDVELVRTTARGGSPRSSLRSVEAFARPPPCRAKRQRRAMRKSKSYPRT